MSRPDISGIGDELSQNIGSHLRRRGFLLFPHSLKRGLFKHLGYQMLKGFDRNLAYLTRSILREFGHHNFRHWIGCSTWVLIDPHFKWRK